MPMEHGLIAVKVGKDEEYLKACEQVGRELFGDGGGMICGDIISLDGVKWFTPGNGCDSFTADVREKMIAAFKAIGFEAIDLTSGGDYQANDKKEADLGYVKVGVAPFKTVGELRSVKEKAP